MIEESHGTQIDLHNPYVYQPLQKHHHTIHAKLPNCRDRLELKEKEEKTTTKKVLNQSFIEHYYGLKQ